MLPIVKVIISIIFTVSGTFLNSAILSVFVRDWKRKTTNQGPCDQVLLCMTLGNLLLQFTLLFNRVLQLFRHVNIYVYFLTYYILLSVTDISFWITAWLALWYCMKLLNSPHHALAQLRSKFRSSVKHLLLGTALTAFGMNLSLFWIGYVKFFPNKTSPHETELFALEVDIAYGVFNVVFVFSLPCLMTLICIGMSIKSLLNHMWKVHQNMSGPETSSSPQLQALSRAAAMMSIRLMLDFCLLTMMMYMFLKFSASCCHPTLGVAQWLFLLSYPSVQCIILIFGNTKLKNSLFGHTPTE